MGMDPAKVNLSYTKVNQLLGQTGDFGLQMQGANFGATAHIGPGNFLFKKLGRVITPVNCKKLIFSVFNNGGEQNFTIPKGCHYIYAKVWGSGGAGGCQGGWTHGAEGGGGGQIGRAHV